MITNIDITNKILIWRIKRFHNSVLKYCEKHNITPKTFSAFLNFKKNNGWVSETYKYLTLAPKYYLVCSKAFANYYNNLDIDFKNDIMTQEEYKQYYKYVNMNHDLKKEIKKLIGDDFICLSEH